MTRVVLFGSQRIALDVLDYLETRDDVQVALLVSSETDRDRLLGCESLVERADRYGVPPRRPDRPERIVDEVRRADPDLLFSVYYRNILPDDLLTVPRLGCVNVHPGLLPFYRGPTPTAWALLNGETRFGITIHLMDSGIDTGDILVQESYAIGRDETGYELHSRAMRLGFELLKEHFHDIVEQRLVPRPQQGTGSYFGRLKPRYVIDWQARVEDIRNAIRVYASPYDRAESRLANRYILIDRAETLSDDRGYVLQGPGRLVDVLDNDELVVSCADGFLLLKEYEILPALTDAEREIFVRQGARLG